MSPRAWLARAQRRRLVRRIAATWGERDALAELELELRQRLRQFDEAHAPAWSPLVTYRGGELIRLPDGSLGRVGGPGKPGVIVAPASGGRLVTYNTLDGSFFDVTGKTHDAPLAVEPGFTWRHWAPALVVAICAAVGVIWGFR